MERKPQQQTLSIRISDTLREFLERSKQVISSARGESVSTSDVAKILLESAKDDRLDHRLEVAELGERPTESLWAIRQKWEVKHPRSRAEWIFMAQYIQVGCEELAEDPLAPGPESFAMLLEALLAVRALRTDRGAGLDRYYLGNLEDGGAWNERKLDAEVVPQVVNKMIREIRASGSGKKAVGAGRNFYVAVRDEEFQEIAALNNALEPYMETLFRFAARGHWIREDRPVRLLRDGPIPNWSIPMIKQGDFGISVQAGNGDVSITLGLHTGDVVYPISTYPQVREFGAMLRTLAPGKIWQGPHFHAFADEAAGGKPVSFLFRRPKDGVQLGFNEDQWNRLKSLFSAALAEPRLQTLLAELSLIYGEL